MDVMICPSWHLILHFINEISRRMVEHGHETKKLFLICLKKHLRKRARKKQEILYSFILFFYKRRGKAQWSGLSLKPRKSVYFPVALTMGHGHSNKHEPLHLRYGMQRTSKAMKIVQAKCRRHVSAASFSYTLETVRGSVHDFAHICNNHTISLLLLLLWLLLLSLIHIWRCRRTLRCRSRWSPYH